MAEQARVVGKLLSLPVDQKEIKVQDLTAVLNKSEEKFQPWNVFELFRAFYPSNIDEISSDTSTNPTVADAANSLKDQITKYQYLWSSISQAADVNREINHQEVSRIYIEASKEERLKYKLFYTRLLEQAKELSRSFKSVLTEMDQIDNNSKASPVISTICELPKEIWFQILDRFTNESLQLCEPFIKATCHPLNVIMREYRTSRSGYHSLAVGSILSNSAANGHLSCVQFLHSVGRKLKQDTMSKAALSGNFELVKFIHETGVNVDWPTVLNAGKSGNFQVFSYAYEHVAKGAGRITDVELSLGCLEGGDLDTIKALIDKRIMRFDAADRFTFLFKHKHAKDIMQLLIEHAPTIEHWKSNTAWTLSACTNGNFACLKYLMEQGFQVHEDCACQPHSLECVKYLYERSFWNMKLIENAAVMGALDVLEFGYEVCQYPLTKAAANVAILRQRDSCLEYLLNNDCPIDEQYIWKAAAVYGTEKSVKLLFAKKVPFNAAVYFEEALAYYHKDKNKSIVLWVAQQGVPLPNNICDLAASAGNLDLLAYAYSCRKPFSAETARRAVESRSVKCLEFVLDRGAAMTEEALRGAAAFNCVPCLAVLLERGCPIPNDIDMILGLSGSIEAGNYYQEFLANRAKK